MDTKDLRIAKMNALGHAVRLLEMRRSDSNDPIDLKELVDVADKLTAWIMIPTCNYLPKINKEKETK